MLRDRGQILFAYPAWGLPACLHRASMRLWHNVDRLRDRPNRRRRTPVACPDRARSPGDFPLRWVPVA